MTDENGFLRINAYLSKKPKFALRHESLNFRSKQKAPTRKGLGGVPRNTSENRGNDTVIRQSQYISPPNSPNLGNKPSHKARVTVSLRFHPQYGKSCLDDDTELALLTLSAGPRPPRHSRVDPTARLQNL